MVRKRDYAYAFFYALAIGCLKSPDSRRVRNIFSAVLLVAVGNTQGSDWSDMLPMHVARAGAAVVEHNDFIYVVGGVDGKRYLATVEYSKIQSGGQLSSWQYTSALPMPRGFSDATVVESYLYVIGGAFGTHGEQLQMSVLRAPILADGSLGGWREHSSLSLPRRCVKVAHIGETLFAVGGFAGQLLDSIDSISLTEDRPINSWALLDTRMLHKRYVHAAKNVGSSLFVIGGHHESEGVGIPNVEWADMAHQPIRFRETEPLNTGRYGLATFTDRDRLYAAGGISGSEFLDDIEMSSIAADGLSKWRRVGYLPQATANFAVVVKNGYIYVVGGTTQQQYHKRVLRARLNEDGTVGAATRNRQNGDTSSSTDFLPNSGTVRSTLHNSSYTYIEIDSRQWLAVPNMEIAVGDRIRFSEGVVMSNFYSKSLQKSFPSIRFVSKVTRE